MANSFLDKTGLTYLWSKIIALVNRKQDALTFDSIPTENSTNPVTSGGVKAYVDANAGGSGDSPFESGTGNGSAVLKNANNMALATYSTAEGYGTHAFGVESHTEGEDTYALGYQAHAEGYRTVAKGYAHSEGLGTTFKLNITGTVGSVGSVYACQSIPDYLKAGMHILKPDTTILIPITAVDRTNKQITCASSLEGTTGKVTVYCSSAYGNGSHTEGSGSAAFGTAAHAEGNNTGAKGANSHAEGYLTEANGGNSHAEGVGTIANSENQHVEGAFNVADTGGTGTYAHITGIGTNNNNRRNGFTVDWSGNGVFAGGVRVGANPSYDNDLTTKQYVDSKVYMAIDERNAPVTLRTRYDEDYGANVLYGYLPSIYEETNIDANAIYFTDAFRYIYEYIDASDNTITIPLTKTISYNSGNYMQKLIFGNGEAVFVDLPSGVMVPEAEWHGDGE